MRPAFYVSLNIYFVNRNASVFPLWPWGEAGGWAWGRGLPASPVGWVVGPRRGGRPRIPPPHRRGPDGAVGKSGPPPGTGAAGPGRPPEVGGGRRAPCAAPLRGKAPGPPLRRRGRRPLTGPGPCAVPGRGVAPFRRGGQRGGGAGRGAGSGGGPCPASPASVFKSAPAAQAEGGGGGVFWLFFFKLCPH